MGHAIDTTPTGEPGPGGTRIGDRVEIAGRHQQAGLAGYVCGHGRPWRRSLTLARLIHGLPEIRGHDGIVYVAPADLVVG